MNYFSNNKFYVDHFKKKSAQFLSILLSLYFTNICAQPKLETYKFSKDILIKIEKDTLAWKYQTGAPELTFSGYYKQALQIWDKTGYRNIISTAADNILFENSIKLSAKNYIVGKSKDAQIVIINEAHHLPQHRTFTRSLLKDLYNNGYRHLGLEAIFDTDINVRKYATLESGYYTKEPEFGNLISEALKLGFKIFGYEASGEKNGKEREIEQTLNIQNYIENNPKGKVIIHCGFAHAFENEYPAWGKAMAGRLKENLNIDPFTIDQTLFLETANEDKNHIFIKKNQSNEAIILKEINGNIYNGKNKQTDIVVIHPQTNFINNRPSWMIKDKEQYLFPNFKIVQLPLLVQAYRIGEFEHNGIPSDIIEIINKDSKNFLYLNKGQYKIILKDKNYNLIDDYIIEIM